MRPYFERRKGELRSLAQSFIPETAAASPEQWDCLEATVEAALAARPRRVSRQVVGFVRLLDLLARVRYGRSLARLDPECLTRMLERLAASPVRVFRRGVWGLRTLIMLGWYTQPGVAAALGYRASAAGWSARR